MLGVISRTPVSNRVRAQGVLLACSALVGLPLVYGGEAVAQQTAQSVAGLEEIVVTARRREENIQSVPVAVTAFSAESLRENTITESIDLARLTPSLAVNQFRRSRANSTKIRGLPGVVSYMAEVPVSTAGGTGRYFDLQNIQVLSGPQGTLFGKNSTGGAILFEPQRPTDAFEGYVQGTFGSYNWRQVEGAVNVPLVEDRVLFRAAGDIQMRNGFTKVLQNGLDMDDRNYKAWRLGLTVKPADWIENHLLYDGYWENQHGESQVLHAVKPNTLIGRMPIALTYLEQQQQAGIRTMIGFDPGYIPTSQAYRSNVTDILRISLTDTISLKNIFGYQYSRGLARFDFDGTPLPTIAFLTGLPGQPSGPTREQAYSDELQLSGTAFGDRLNWVAGGFWQYSSPIGFDSTTTAQLGSARNTYNRSQQRSKAVYAQGTYDLSELVDGVKFTAGFRETWDFRSLDQRALTPTGACNLANVAANCIQSDNTKYKAPSWTFSLDYQVDANKLIYVTSRRGFIAGGFNAGVPRGSAGRDFSPEKNIDVEIGIKADWNLGGVAARTNLAVFRNWYSNIQAADSVFITQPDGSTRLASVIVNAAKASVKGIEGTVTVSPLEGLELSANGSYIDAKYVEYTTFAGVDLTNAPFRFFPDSKFNLSAAYALPLEPTLGEVELSATFSWQSSSLFVEGSDLQPGGEQGPWGTLNLRADWRDVAGYPIDLAAFVTNVTNRKALLGGTTIYNTFGFSASTWNEPRMVGAQIRYRFAGN